MKNHKFQNAFANLLSSQKGLSLIEVMISLLIAAIVLAAVLISVAATARSSIVQNEQSAMIENGQYALNLLSRHIRNAGYESLTEVGEPTIDRKRFGRYLFGCGSGVLGGETSTLPAWGVSCVSSGSNDAIAVRYQGGQLAVLPNTSDSVTDSIYQTTDCAGKEVTDKMNRGDGTDIAIIDNRFYVNSASQLVCWGNGNKAAWPLVQNIEQLKFSYGVADRVKSSSGFELLEGRIARYMTAAQLASTYASDTDPWERVMSVRVCVVTRSSKKVILPTYDYIDCDGNSQTSSDNYARKAMFTIVEVPNVGAGL